MRARFLWILTGVVAASCGGGGGGDLGFKVTETYPDLLASLSAQLGTQATIYGQGATILSSPAKGVAEEGVWNFSVEPLGDVTSSFVRIEYKYEDAGGGIYDGVAFAYVDIPLASIEGDTPYPISSDDFNFSADDDQDGLPNLNEFLLGVNPNLADTDGDGVPDGLDVFPSISVEWLDTDGDGIGDNTDDDIDGDGLTNAEEDIRGTNKFRWDTDGDGIYDGIDNCALVSNGAQEDRDADGRGNACDDDSDADGLSDSDESLRRTDRLNPDTDGDGLGDGTEVGLGTNPLSADTDSDGVGDRADNCRLAANSTQADIDRDGLGDACDSDKDGDSVPNTTDNCPETSNRWQDDLDGDRLGDECDPDADNDGVPNGTDNCPFRSNPAQLPTDTDSDGVTVECDLDDTDAGVGTDRNAVFVDGAHGSDTARGTRAQPIATLPAAVAKARAEDLRIYVAAGEYGVSTLSVVIGTRIYGGFANGDNPALRFASRDVRSTDAGYKTKLVRTDVATTLVLSSSGVVLNGLHIENGAAVFDAVNPSVTVSVTAGSVLIERSLVKGNSASSRSLGFKLQAGSLTLSRNRIEGGGFDARGSTSAAVSVEGGEARITNNILIAGAGRFATGLFISAGSPIVANNTIDARSGSTSFGVAQGVNFGDASPVIANNVIVTGNASDQYVLSCGGAPPSVSAAFRGNLLARFPNETALPVAYDCDGLSYTTAAFRMGDATVDSNARFAGAAYGNLLDAAYALVGGGGSTDGVDDGINTGTSVLGSVVVDLAGAARPRGAAYDIGAIER